MELGGNAGVIIEPDANLENATARIVAGAFALAGQSCVSVQRVYVQSSIASKLEALLVAAVSKLKAGDPLDESTSITPMIDTAAAKRTEEWVNESVSAGGVILCGGKRTGALLEPTIIKNPPATAKVCAEEVFAPLLVLMEYEKFEDAVSAVNNSRYGLQAGVYTSDISKIWHAFENLEVGAVMVNEVPTYRVDHQPYGGVKGSGVGREGPRYLIEELTEPRMLGLKVR